MKYLVCWRDMQKGSDEPLPMRPFTTRTEAETYIMGCADVICIGSGNKLEPSDVIKDFTIEEAQ